MSNKKANPVMEASPSYFVRMGKQILLIPHEARVKSLHIAHPLQNTLNALMKRVFDILFAGFVIVFLLSWIIPIIGLMILIDSGWPIFFVQPRHGKNSQEFRCFKFRTMIKNGESHTRQSSANDERITRLGRMMRRYNLDELPQFFNVLLGDMSIVGPRPHMKNHTLEYEKVIPYYRERLLVKPGVTGMAQARGNHGPTPTVRDMKHRVDYDMFYIRNWSLWLDVRLVWDTFLNIFRASFHK